MPLFFQHPEFQKGFEKLVEDFRRDVRRETLLELISLMKEDSIKKSELIRMVLEGKNYQNS